MVVHYFLTYKSMSIESTTHAITENKFMMQLFADQKSMKADLYNGPLILGCVNIKYGYNA